jgi:hypothetical protein
MPVPRETPPNKIAPVSFEVKELLIESCHSIAATVTNKITPQSTELREQYLSILYDSTVGVMAVAYVICY